MDKPPNENSNVLSLMECGSRIVAFLVVFFVLVLTLRIVLDLFPEDVFSWMGDYKFIAYACLNLFCSMVSIVVSRYGLKKEHLNLGLRAPLNTSVLSIVVGFLLGGIFVSIVIALNYLTGGYQVLSFNQGANLLPYFFLFLVGAFHEELVFRGYFYQLIAKATTRNRAIAISSILFGFAHMINNIEGVSLLEKVFACSFLSLEAGLSLTIAFILTGNIWFAFGLHWAWNFIQGAIFGANVSGLEMGQSLISAKLTDGILGGGGSFGPEYTLAGLGTGLLLFYLLLAYDRKKRQTK